MTGRRWTAPFFLGMAVAVVAETGVGLLLFVSPGLLPALTVILATVLGSLGLGLSMGAPRPAARPRGSGPPGRWRWFTGLGGLVLAALLSLGWSFQGGVPEGGFSRGIHLAALVAVPIWSLGACLAAVLDSGSAAAGASAAVLGGMTGVAVMGLLLVPRFEPASVYIFCVLCLSVAALDRRIA